MKGFTGYQWIALGEGPFEGINLLWGPCQEPDQYPERRRVRLMIGSAQCWRARAAGFSAVGLAGEALTSLEGLVLAQRPADEAIAVRRIDVAVDHWGYDWTRADLDRFKARAKSRASVEQGERMDPERREFIGPETATYYVGSRGAAARMLRVYNKVAEAAASGKLEWMQDAWRAAGWNGSATVWRAEIEHGGQWLKDHGFVNATHLAGCERALWDDYLLDVVHVKATSKRLRRCLPSPAWKAITKAVLSRPGGTWQWKPKPPSKGGDLEQLMAQAAGCLESAGRHLRASYLLPLGPEGQLTGMAASQDDQDGELLRLVQEYMAAKRLREAEKDCKAAL